MLAFVDGLGYRCRRLRRAVFDWIDGWYNTRRLSHGERGLWRDVA